MAQMITILLIWAATCAGTEDQPLWLAVGRPGLVDELGPLAQKRRAEGFSVIVSTKTIQESLAAAPQRPAFLLLVGDDEPGKQAEPWYLPAKRLPLYRWMATQRAEFASDSAWGDFDGDNLADIPVGRIPARTPQEVRLVVRKILAFEQQPPTDADLCLPVWVGAPGYGGPIDQMASNLLVNIVQTHAPGWAQESLIAADSHHVLCGWPPDQPGVFTRQLRRGALIGIMLGHAYEDRWYSMQHKGAWIGYTAAHAQEQFAAGPPTAPLTFLACSCGRFSHASPCMAESFLWMPGGPVATVGATTESHPLTNYFTGVSLLQALQGKEKRLGTVWLRAQRDAMKARDFMMEQLLKNAEGKLEEKIDIGKLKRDQLLMYALLGDPATRLRIPDALEAAVERTASGWHWRATRPAGAVDLQVALRAQSASIPAANDSLSPSEARRVFKEANARFAFNPCPGAGADGPWEGTVNENGRLRLIASGPGVFRVAVLELEPSDKPAATTPQSPK